MKSTNSRRSRLHGALSLALLAGCLAEGLAAAQATPPSVRPLLPGKWPVWPRGEARSVKVVGNYAYLALGYSGLVVLDVSNPTNCLQVGVPRNKPQKYYRVRQP